MLCPDSKLYHLYGFSHILETMALSTGALTSYTTGQLCGEKHWIATAEWLTFFRENPAPSSPGLRFILLVGVSQVPSLNIHLKDNLLLLKNCLLLQFNLLHFQLMLARKLSPGTLSGRDIHCCLQIPLPFFFFINLPNSWRLIIDSTTVLI